MQPSRIHITTLGVFSVSHEGRPVNVGRNKNKALLAFLSLNAGRTYTREFLADLLWTDSDAEKSKHSLNQAIYSIRRVIPEILEVTAKTVAAVPDKLSTDIQEISKLLTKERSDDLLQLIKGEFLQDVAPACGETFDEWRSMVNRDFFNRIDAQLAAAIEQSSSPASLDGAGLFGLELLPASRAALSRKPGTVKPRTAAQQDVRATHGHAPLPFAARTEQITELQHAWRQCIQGTSQRVAILGKPGVGKTRLITEFLKQVKADEATVITTTCYQSEKRIGFAVATDLVGEAMRMADEDAVGTVWWAVLKALLPTRARDTQDLPPLSAPVAQVRLFEAVRHLLSALSASLPLIVFVDDVQWCDKSSRSLLAYLGHRLRSERVMIVVSARPRPSDIDGQRGWPDWQRITLKEFSTADIHSITSSIQFPTAKPSAADLKRISGGNPYFLSELIRQLLRGNDLELDDRTTSRAADNARPFINGIIGNFPRPAQQCLAALSVIGRPVRLPILRAVVRRHDVDASVEHLVTTGLAIFKGDRITLRHDLIRHAVYVKLSTSVRAKFHRRVARLAARSERRAGETAHHYFKAGERQLAHKFAVAGVHQADVRYANEESTALLKLALRARPKAAVELRPMLIERLHRAHKFAEARSEIQRHLTAQCDKDEARVLRLQLLDLELAYRTGSIDGSTFRTRISDLKRRAEGTSPSIMLALVRAESMSAFHDGKREEMAMCAPQFLTLLGALGVQERCEAMALAAHALAVTGHVSGANEILPAVLPIVDQVADFEKKIWIQFLIAVVRYTSGDLVGAEIVQREALSTIERIGAMSLWPGAATHLHMFLLEQGKYADADELANQIRARAEEMISIHALVVLNANTANKYFELGDYVNCRKAAELALSNVERNESQPLKLAVLGILGLCALEQGYRNEAFEYAKSAVITWGPLEVRLTDSSYLEILLSRIDMLKNKPVEAINRLRSALEYYADGDVVCRLRIQCELARSLKATDRNGARRHAKEVYEKARAIGARPLADRADSLLHRL